MVLARSTPICIVDIGLLLEVVALGAVMLDAVCISGRSPYHHLLRSGPFASATAGIYSSKDAVASAAPPQKRSPLGGHTIRSSTWAITSLTIRGRLEPPVTLNARPAASPPPLLSTMVEVNSPQVVTL